MVQGRSDDDLHVDRGLEATLDADLVCLSPKRGFLDHDPAVPEAVRAAYERGAIIYAHCSNAPTTRSTGSPTRGDSATRPRCVTTSRGSAG